jgi:cell surface protein SprA
MKIIIKLVVDKDYFLFTADYKLSNSLTASFYYNHQTSKYAISTTFPRQAVNGGFNIIYNLGGN